jgi:signal transduction histidine kinase
MFNSAMQHFPSPTIRFTSVRQKIGYYVFMNKYLEIEPRVLSIFRLFVGLGLALSVPGLLVSQLILNITRLRIQLVSILVLALLFAYLSFPKIQRMMKRAYLPLGLYVAAILPIITQRWLQGQTISDPGAIALVAQQYRIDFRTGVILSSNDWVISLFIPLVLIAWQYNLRSVLTYSFVTAIVDLVLSMRFLGTERTYIIVLINTIVTRSFAFMLIGFIVSRLVARQRQQQDELSNANKQLSNYTTILENFTVNLEQLATSQERNRLARELHDTLAHTLSALSVQLEATDTLWKSKPEQAHQMLQDALGTTRSGLKETRRALQALRASPLDDLGLELAIRNLAHSAAERSGFSIDVDIPQPINDLKPHIEQTTYRVLQESLENISRHANARHVSLSLKRVTGSLVALIVDDGTGFDLQHIDQEEKLGLRGMKERVEVLGGNLEIQSTQGKGTTIRLTMNEAIS